MVRGVFISKAIVTMLYLMCILFCFVLCCSQLTISLTRCCFWSDTSFMSELSPTFFVVVFFFFLFWFFFVTLVRVTSSGLSSLKKKVRLSSMRVF